MLALAKAAAPWTKLEVAEPKGFDTTFEQQTSGATLFDYFKTVGSACDLGFGSSSWVKTAQKTHVEVWRPTADPNNRFRPGGAACGRPAGHLRRRQLCQRGACVRRWRGRSRAMVCGRHRYAEPNAGDDHVDARDQTPEDSETQYQRQLPQKAGRPGRVEALEQLRTGSIDDAGRRPRAGDVWFLPLLPIWLQPPSGWPTSLFRESESDGTTITARGWVRPSLAQHLGGDSLSSRIITYSRWAASHPDAEDAVLYGNQRVY